MMRTSRRQFLEFASKASALLPMAKLASGEPAHLSLNAAAGAMEEHGQLSSAPSRAFDGKSLQGWHVQGSGKWRVEDGEIVGLSDPKGSGWLVLDRGLEDFELKFSFRASGGEAGVLLRNAPLTWSRFSHPPRSEEDKTAGLYVVLSGPHAGEMSMITLDPHGMELERKVLPPPPLDVAGRVNPLYTGACSPIACVGINDPQGATSGFPPEPPVRISPSADGWQRADISLRGVAAAWDTTGVAALLDARSQFGEAALRISGGPDAAFHIKDVTITDLTQRVAGLAGNSGESRFQQLTDLFYSEGIAVGDLNRDGHDEVIAGPFYYEGPDFHIAREIFPPTTVNPGGAGEHGNYSNCFLIHVNDFTGDGWPDVLMIMGFGQMPSFSAHLFVNPRGERRHWDNYNVVPIVNTETTQLADVDGDGRPELVMAQGNIIGYAKPEPSDPTKPWVFHPISEKGSWGPHGFGVGDVNGDGRVDIVQASGWWEQPPLGTPGLWKFHPAPFGATEGEWFLRGGADIFVYDVNGDGVPDVITSLNGHGPGLAWFEQQRDAGGKDTWKRHLIMGDPSTPIADRKEWEETDKTVAFTELHALALADLDGDGSIDIITGKRWWSHGYISDENDLNDPPVLYRFKLVRKSGGAVEWVPKLIHNASGVGTQIVAKDINQDGKPEILTTARKGRLFSSIEARNVKGRGATSMFCFKNAVRTRSVITAGAALLCGVGAWAAHETAQPYTTWSTYLGSSDSSHYSALKQINRSNVHQLQVAWSYETESDRSYEFNPIIVGKMMYVLAKHTSVVALDAATGKEIWTYHSKYAPTIEMHRGINFWQSKDGSEQRLLIPFANHLEAIDARSGQLITSFGDNGRVDLRVGLGRDPETVHQIQSATPGRVFEDLLILGSTTGEEYDSPPGDIRAYDVRTGKMAWIFHTVPHPGELGYDTWPKDAWKVEGGTNCWGEMSLDEQRGIVYIPTGAPTYDFYGAERTGNNLFADSLLALDARTGKLVWYYQLVHHDLWDYDSTAAPQLLTVRHDGKEVPVVAQATKNGFVYVFDRVTGKPIWPIEERPVPKSDMPDEVTSPTQPFPTQPPPFARQSFTMADINTGILTAEEQERWKKIVANATNKGLFTPPGQTDTVELPGNHGGANWGMTAVNPTDGTLFVMSMDIPAFLKIEHRLPPNLWEIPMDVPPAQQGKAIYHLYCERCHGADRTGAPPSIPSLVNAPAVYGEDTIKTVVRNGRQEMPAFGDLSDLHIKNLILYLGNPASAPAPIVEPEPSKVEAKASGAPVRYWSGYNLQTAVIKPPFSTITAYDLNAGTIKWQIPVGNAPPAELAGLKNTGIMMPRNGPVVTAGGLIFVATKFEGKLHAYDQRTGEEVWSVELPAAAEGVPSVYQVDGQEFLVICATTGKQTAIPRDGPSQPTGGPVHRSYVAFALPKQVAAKH